MYSVYIYNVHSIHANIANRHNFESILQYCPDNIIFNTCIIYHHYTVSYNVVVCGAFLYVYITTCKI